ncbi:MAG TPA: YtxH domain-containing protein [Gemmatimonadaceae bacterium]|nr:YtxH domain-containing protein [Gemmatimonadaceae bacterium]
MARHRDYEDFVDEGPIVVVEERKTSVAAFFWGALLGAGAALLLAPQSGAETRDGLVRGARKMSSAARDMAEELGDTVVDKYDHARHSLENRFHTVRRAVEVKRHQAAEAVRAGRAAAEAARNDLERRIAESGNSDGALTDATRTARRPRRARGGTTRSPRGSTRAHTEEEPEE